MTIALTIRSSVQSIVCRASYGREGPALVNGQPIYSPTLPINPPSSLSRLRHSESRWCCPLPISRPRPVLRVQTPSSLSYAAIYEDRSAHNREATSLGVRCLLPAVDVVAAMFSSETGIGPISTTPQDPTRCLRQSSEPACSN